MKGYALYKGEVIAILRNYIDNWNVLAIIKSVHTCNITCLFTNMSKQNTPTVHVYIQAFLNSILSVYALSKLYGVDGDLSKIARYSVVNLNIHKLKHLIFILSVKGTVKGYTYFFF